MSDHEFMTYDQAAERLNIDRKSVQRQANRRKWPRKNGNDGRVLVGVPTDRLSPPTVGSTVGPTVHDLQAQVTALSIELAAEKRISDAQKSRADAAESDRDRWHQMAVRPWWKRLAG